jgi:SAM-dependent methyltransferase
MSEVRNIAVPTLKEYIGDDADMRRYQEYQKRYAATIREFEKVVIRLIGEVSQSIPRSGEPLTLLDIGCSTGNFLMHLRNTFPQMLLTGGDVAPGLPEVWRENPQLFGIQLRVMDILELPRDQRFDIVCANAALMFFDDAQFDLAIQNIASVVEDGGWFVGFDLFHPFEQELAIIEHSKAKPNGVQFRIRSYERVRRAFTDAGLATPSFVPFHLPIDIDRPTDPSDITTYTVRSREGHGMSFRGTLHQPWCHFSAQRTARAPTDS